jgi:hypothetical protein
MRRSLLGIILLLVFMEPLGFADSIVLKNGDRLSGVVEGISEGKLTLKTDYAGTIRIDWNAIATWNGKSISGPPPASVQPASVNNVTPAKVTPAKAAQRFNKNRFSLHVDFNQDYSIHDSSYQFSNHILSSYVGAGKWDAFLTTHVDLDSSSTNQTAVALGSVNRYLTRRFFVYPSYLALHISNDPPYWVTAQYAGAGAGWTFRRNPDEMLFVRSGLYASNISGILASASGPQPIVHSPLFADFEIVDKTTPFSWLELSGTIDLFHALQSGTQFRLFFDTTARIPISKKISLDLHFYDPPDTSQSGVVTLHNTKISSGLGYAF